MSDLPGLACCVVGLHGGIGLLTATTTQWLARARDGAQRHRRKLSALAVTALAGYGITAFGIAPMAPDAADLPRTTVTETIVVEDLEAQSEALAATELPLWRSDVSRGAETAESLLRRLGVDDAELARFLRSDALARKMLQGRSKMLQVQTTGDGKVVELVARFAADNPDQARSHFTRLSVTRAEGRLYSRIETAALTASTRLASGSIRSSVWAAADEARLPDAVAVQLAEIFSGDIDFHREVQKGDTFSVVYETVLADGQPVVWNEGAGRVLAAEFVNRGRTHHALWFPGANGRGGYFGLDGSSKRRQFLASPLEFSRITSGFAMRFHPVLQVRRAHLGVDYAAPIGTPVRSVGDGLVSFAGWQNGYGKVIIIQHPRDHSTLYGHLNAINVRKGERVAQGQFIGASGNTGMSTGPHLHFEFRIAGRHQDPQRVARNSQPVTIDASARQQFGEVARSLQAKLDVAETLIGVAPVRTE